MSEAKRTCFVISPIGHEGSDIRRHADAVLEKIILPATQALNFERPLRADHLGKAGEISRQIFERIAADDLCIAVLTDGNANVCYEIGAAHTAGKPVLSLIAEGQSIPSDFSVQRAVKYDIAAPEKSVRELIGLIRNVIEQEKWSLPSIIPGILSLHKLKHDVFISAPMTSIGPDDYKRVRASVLSLANALKQFPAFSRVYSAAVNIGEIDNVDPPNVSAAEDLRALRLSQYFILLYPAGVPSSSLVETGYALAMGKPSAYLYRNIQDLPFMLREVAQAHPNVKTFQYSDEKSLTVQVRHIHTLLVPKVMQ